jgi:hypothetical protein
MVGMVSMTTVIMIKAMTTWQQPPSTRYQPCQPRPAPPPPHRLTPRPSLLHSRRRMPVELGPLERGIQHLRRCGVPQTPHHATSLRVRQPPHLRRKLVLA